MDLYVFMLALCASGLAQEWAENKDEGYEYYYDGSNHSAVFSYEEAMSKCAEQGATLVMIKTKEVEDFILAQGWPSKCFFAV